MHIRYACVWTCILDENKQAEKSEKKEKRILKEMKNKFPDFHHHIYEHAASLGSVKVGVQDSTITKRRQKCSKAKTPQELSSHFHSFMAIKTIAKKYFV